MFSNWKTTLAGLGAGALTAFAHGGSWQSILAGLAIAALGLLSKDYTS